MSNNFGVLAFNIRVAKLFNVNLLTKIVRSAPLVLMAIISIVVGSSKLFLSSSTSESEKSYSSI